MTEPEGDREGLDWQIGVWNRISEIYLREIDQRFAGPPPVPGVGPGALADATPFLQQLAEVGIEAHIETEMLGFDFPDFPSAWNALAGVTTAHLPPDQQQEAQRAVMDIMYARGDAPRHFNNLTQFIIGRAGP